MYEIRPESIITFIEDNSIRLPRFQRKQTWDAKKNFELCISVFKEFPIGVCILNVESEERGRTTKWLLDGRQRRNALLRMWEDPENIYQWARKWVGFKPGDQPADVEEKFRAKMADYLEDDDEDLGMDVDENSGDDEAVYIENDEEQSGEIETPVETFELSRDGLDFLLQIIRLIHNKTSRYSGFTRPFDFAKAVSTLPYLENSSGKISLNSKKLKSFIIAYKQHCRDESIDADDVNSFKHFMMGRFDLSADARGKLERQIDENWTAIIERIEILERIHELLMQSKIGLIELKNIRTTDSQKIFNIINSKGTKLNAVEILSAKPSWNSRILNPSDEQQRSTSELYDRIDVRNDGVVKWDLPATLLPRMKDAKSFFRFGGEKNTGLDKQLTLGFKLLSGLYQNGVRKEDVDSLSKNNEINWELEFETRISEFNNFSRILLSSNYFRFFATWRASVMNITSDAVALNFFLVMFRDWERKGRPTGNDANTRMFQKNGLILIDQLFFEYVNRQWRGSSDSKIALNLANVNTLPALFVPITKERWTSLLDEIFEKNTIDGVKITQGLMIPMLFHFYAMSGIAGPTGHDDYEVDHIIPQSLFKSALIPDAAAVQNNLFNLGLLPKRDNISKGNKRLVEIDDLWLKSQIRLYEFIQDEDYARFSSLNNLDQLKEFRAPIFYEAFTEKRDELLAN